MLPYFDRVAADLWDGKWETIVATRNACDRERLFIEATILCRYGKSLSLRGTPQKVRDLLAAARRCAGTEDRPSAWSFKAHALSSLKPLPPVENTAAA
jgi:hypothetical protein